MTKIAIATPLPGSDAAAPEPAPFDAASASGNVVALHAADDVASVLPDDLPLRKPSRNGWRDLLLYGLIALLVALTWLVSRMQLYDSKSDIAYWLGVSGGVGMLLLLTYPMRKHLRFMRHSGPAGHWFFGHMVLGVSGPVLILLHAQYHLGSLNATVAFYSMIVVAISGVVGRFLYLRVHRSLDGQKETLAQLRERLALDNDAATRLRFAPAVIARCRRFERFALEQRMVSGAEVIRAMFVVPWVRWSAALACRAELRRRLVAVAHTQGWSRRRLHSRLRQANSLAGAYLAGAQRVAMFAAWERLFSWWHIGHVPFVYILAISAIVHVVAVHAY